MNLRNEEKIAAIGRWQDASVVHPLTCGMNSSHGDLRGEERGGEVFLVCPTCGRQQDRVPGHVYESYDAQRGWSGDIYFDDEQGGKG